jgi:integrase/recombinase XerC/integrase/recombinase XerD
MSSRLRRRGWQDVDKSDILVTDLVQAFLMHHEDRNHSPKTVRWYNEMLGRFTAWLGPEARLRDVDGDTLRNYQRSLREGDLSKFTLHAYARTLRTFLRWLEREAYLGEELYRRVEMPKVPKYEDVTIDVLSDQEIAHLLSMLDPSTDVGCRNRAIVCLMLESGLRLAEVVNLKFDDVHLKELYVKVHGKGDKEAYVPIGPTTQKALSRYGTYFRVPADPKTRAFFLNIYGEPLGYEAVKSMFVRLAKESGITRLHPHLLRHTAATRMLANGADLHTVQRLLRHSDIRTTLRYLHLVPEQLQEKMRMFSPLGGIAEQRQRMVPRRLTRVK